jgi:hypothetical protein
MAADNIANVLREVATLQTAQQNRIAAAVRPEHAINQAKALTFPIGTPVLDLVTGEKGTVIDGKHANVLVSSSR